MEYGKQNGGIGEKVREEETSKKVVRGEGEGGTLATTPAH